MASVKLPWELEEEILSRLPPLSLVRFRAVCKHWNALFNDTMFVNNHFALARPQFIFLTKSKTYSINIDLGGVDPTIEVHELASDCRFQAMKFMYSTIMACDGLLFRDFYRKGVAVWNPWLRQVGWIEYEDKDFCFCGVGYGTSKPEKGYKILGYFYRFRNVGDIIREGYRSFAIYECSSRAFKFLGAQDWPKHVHLGESVSFNGDLYWTAFNEETREYFIGSFDFSMEIFKLFCLLPCVKKVSGQRHELVLTVFKGDRFALLKPCCMRREIEIWVTEKKIIKNNKDEGELVVWLNLMTLSIPNFPWIYSQFSWVSYFIYDKTLIMCCDDENRVAWIFIAREDMCKKFQIDSRFFHFCQCVYLPNLISVPSKFRSLQV